MRWGFFLPALLAAGPAMAQVLPPDTLLYDTFRTNESNWPTGATNTQLAEMTSAGYRLRCTDSDPNGNASKSKFFTLTDEQDWSFAAQVQVQRTGGLIFGNMGHNGHGQADYQTFTLVVDGAAPVAELWHCTEHWKKQFSLPLPAGFDPQAAHRLRVAREGSKMSYYVDEQRLPEQTSAPRHWPGALHDLGFYAERPGAEVLVSQVLIRHTSRIRLAPGIPRGLRRERLPGGINTPAMEESPVVSADGRWLFFVRTLGNPTVPGQRNEDGFVAERQADGSWSTARNIGAPVNTSKNDNIIGTSPDGQSLLVSGTYTAAGELSSGEGLSQSSARPGAAWTVPAPYGTGLLSPAGGEFAQYFVDASGQVALVAGDRAGDLGNIDMYVSHRRPNGSWSRLQSLGPTLNTAGAEQSPFLAPDGVTLYFASDVHPGYGDSDIFVTKRLDDSWTKWSEPLNLGPAVNTPRYENGFTLPASGEYAYLMSEQPGAATYDQDLYRLLLPPALRPAPTVLVKGRVLDARTGQPVAAAQLRYEQLPGGTQVGEARMAAAGSFVLALPAGQLYGFRAEAPGYLSASDNLDLTTAQAYSEVVQDLYLLPLEAPIAALTTRPAALAAQPTPAEANPKLKALALSPAVHASPVAAPTPVPVPIEEKIALHNLFFVRGKPDLLPSSNPELDRLAQTLSEHPTLAVRLDGYTDNTGDDQDPQPNRELSRQRAEAVKAYLTAHGVAAGRLTTQGFGGQHPVAKNDTEAHKARNRRVECVIVSR